MFSNEFIILIADDYQMLQNAKSNYLSIIFYSYMGMAQSAKREVLLFMWPMTQKGEKIKQRVSQE